MLNYSLKGIHVFKCIFYALKCILASAFDVEKLNFFLLKISHELFSSKYIQHMIL